MPSKNTVFLWFEREVQQAARFCTRTFPDSALTGAMVVKDEAFERFNTLVDEQNRLMAWGASSVGSWYKNSRGRVSQNWPLPLEDYFAMTERPEPGDFDLLA